MRRALGLAAAAGTVTVLGALGTLAAQADWTVPVGKSTLIARAAKMPRGVSPSAAKQSAQAVVSWSAQEIAVGIKMDHYVVTAHRVDDPSLPDVSHTVGASGAAVESLTFTANEIGGGKWYWTVVPEFHLWTGAESGKSQRLTFPAAPVAAPSPAASPAASFTPTTSVTPTTLITSPSGTPPTEDPTPPVVESAPVSDDLPPPSTEPVKDVPESRTPAAPPTSMPAGE